MSTQTPDREAWGLVLELFFSHHRPRVWGVAAEFDLAPMQMLALKNLDPDQELPTSSLAELLHCDASNVTGIVDRLEARGLIERRPSAEDRRVKMLALTEEGQEMRRQIGARMSEPPPPITSLSEEDQARCATCSPARWTASSGGTDASRPYPRSPSRPKRPAGARSFRAARAPGPRRSCPGRRRCPLRARRWPSRTRPGRG